MRASRAAVVAGLCAAIVGAGYAASPKELPSLDLVVPVAQPATEPAVPEPGLPDPAVPASAAAASRAPDEAP